LLKVKSYQPKAQLEVEWEETSEISTQDSEEVELSRGGKRTRHKERRIGEVVDLVLKWRKLYNGVKDPITGENLKYSLEEAAKKVGVAKKSLDDYLLMIKHARVLGFDFQENHLERFGILRSFVKTARGIKDGTIVKRGENDDEDGEYLPKKNRRSKKIKKEKKSCF